MILGNLPCMYWLFICIFWKAFSTIFPFFIIKIKGFFWDRAILAMASLELVTQTRLALNSVRSISFFLWSAGIKGMNHYNQEIILFYLHSVLLASMFIGVCGAYENWKRATESEPPCGCWEPNPGPLEEQRVLLSPKLLLRSQEIIFALSFVVILYAALDTWIH